MILYVNGDSHSAGAEAVNPYAFAEDDRLYWGLGRQPHPDNLKVSYGCEIANHLGAILHCDAESASSNHRIIRTTYDYLVGVQGLPANRPDYIIIGWSTWERKEFFDHVTKKYWQVNAGGVGHDWPEWLKEQYPKWISEINWAQETNHANNKIFQFHKDLTDKGIRHLFFNTFGHLDPAHVDQQHDWGNSYIGPYDSELTYYNWCTKQGFKPVYPGSYHFGPDAHRAWAEFLLQYMVQNELTN